MLGPALRQIAAKPAGDPGGPRKFAGADQDCACRERGEAAVVIDVQMGEDDQPDVARRRCRVARNCGSGFLLRFDVEAHRERK